MTQTDGPAALRRLAEKMPLHFESLEMIDLAAAWDAEREQAAADRAEIVNCLENIRELTAQRAELGVKLEEAYKALEVIGTRKDTAEAALAQARALMAEQADIITAKMWHIPPEYAARNILLDVAAKMRDAAALSGGAR